MTILSVIYVTKTILKDRLKLEDIKARNGISNAGEMRGFRSMEQ